jgi:hypothetical protein
VAGTISISVTSGSTSEVTQTVNFTKAYASQPTIVVTPFGDPEPESKAMPKFWVTITQGTNSFSGFTLHYVPAVAPTANRTLTFFYHVFG